MVKEIEKVLRVGKELSEYLIGLSFEDLLGDVVHQAKRVLLDSIGTMFMGARKEEAGGIINFLSGLGERQECSVVGADFKTSPPWAAFIMKMDITPE